jgi:hypothetical protein
LFITEQKFIIWVQFNFSFLFIYGLCFWS